MNHVRDLFELADEMLMPRLPLLLVGGRRLVDCEAGNDREDGLDSLEAFD